MIADLRRRARTAAERAPALPFATAATRRVASRYFTERELEKVTIRGLTLKHSDVAFRLKGFPRPRLEPVRVPEDPWLRQRIASAPPDERTWELVAFLKVRRLNTPEEVIERARTGDLYDESYFTKRGGGAPYVGYPYEYNGGMNDAAPLAEALVETYAPQRALDVGAATGELVRELQRRGVDAHGIDFSRWAVDHRVTDTVVHGSATELPWEDGSFDLVTSQDFMEHIHPDDLPKVMAEQVRVLKPGGRAVHLIPFYDFDEPVQVDAHLCQASQRWWSGFLRGIEGLEIVREPSGSPRSRLDHYYELRRV